MRGAVLSVLASVAASAAVSLFFGTASGRAAGDAAEAWLAANRAEVDRQVLADVERYGADIYRLHMEVSQMLPGMPADNFGGDKAVKKLEVTYPDSHVRALAEAYVVYGAIRRRDMLRIEQYLRSLEDRPSDAPAQLMPNGFEIEPQLVVAQYDYYFHIERFDEAEKTLNYLADRFGGSWLFQPQGKPFAAESFVQNQRQILAAVKRGIRK